MHGLYKNKVLFWSFGAKKSFGGEGELGKFCEDVVCWICLVRAKEHVREQVTEGMC